MRRLILLFLLPGLTPATTSGATSEMSTESIQNDEQLVLATEDEWIQAEIERDETTLRRVIDDKFAFNHSDGTTSGKEDLIGMVRGWNMLGQTLSERTVVMDGDTAIIMGTTELRFASADDEDQVQLLRYTATYVKRRGQWRAIALQMSERRT